MCPEVFQVNFNIEIPTPVRFVFVPTEHSKIPIGKAILNVLLPALVVLIPLAVVAFILGDLFA